MKNIENKSKIQSVECVTQRGSGSFWFLGRSYNDLELEEIKDQSCECDNGLFVIYTGYTKDGDTVFEIINVPCEVQYTK